MRHLKLWENFWNKEVPQTIATEYELKAASEQGDTFSETPLGEVDGFKLVYQTHSKLMGGNGINGTIRTAPQNYYVATISDSGEISFEDLEANTRDINKKRVEKLYKKLKK